MTTKYIGVYPGLRVLLSCVLCDFLAGCSFVHGLYIGLTASIQVKPICEIFNLCVSCVSDYRPIIEIDYRFRPYIYIYKI